MGLGKWLIEGVGNYLIASVRDRGLVAGRAARQAGRAWACPRFRARGAAEVSGVRAGPQGRRAERDAEQP